MYKGLFHAPQHAPRLPSPLVLRRGWAVLGIFMFCCLFASIPPDSLAEEATDVSQQVQPEENNEQSSATSSFAKRIKQKQEERKKSAEIGSEVPDMGFATGKTAKGLVYCLAGIFVIFSLYKRFAAGDSGQLPANAIEILGRRQIGSKSALLVVEAEGQRFLLSQSGEDTQLLAELSQGAAFGNPLSQLSVLDERGAADNKPNVSANG